MSQAGPHYPLIVALLAALALGGLILGLSAYLGPRRPTAVKLEPFECGNPAGEAASGRFNVKFYLVAILFLVFDIEAVFVYPWAIVFHEAVQGEAGLPAAVVLGEMVSFVAIVGVALAYIWRKGALDWAERATS